MSPSSRLPRPSRLAPTALAALCLCFPLLLPGDGGWAQSSGADARSLLEEVPITVQRISDQVANFRVGDQPPFGDLVVNNVVVFSTEKGLVVVDTGYFPRSAHALRRLISETFGRDDFAYVVNTHGHWDHVSGNRAFADVPIIGHADLPLALAQLEEDLPGVVSGRAARRDYWQTRLEQLPPGSPEAMEATGWSWAHGRFVEEARSGYGVVLPSITFSDHLTLHLGDLTLQLFHVPGIHTAEDLVVFAPEAETLVTGDLFFPGEEVQVPDSAGVATRRLLDILSSILDGEAPVATVVPGHCCLKDRDWLEAVRRRLESATKTRVGSRTRE